MNQFDLMFGVRPRFPRAHRDDPVSSHEAAAAGESSGLFKRQAERVLAALKRFPLATSAELTKLANDPALDLYAVRRRLDDLKKVNLVRRIDPTDDMKPCEVSGRRVCRWESR
jgi:DNA-binding MarR family transcriptional regulator